MRRATPRTAFLAVVHAALAQIETNARGVLESDNAEFLHQLRVGMRRLRSALRAFRDALPPKSAKRLVRTLRRLSPKLGRARDWDVLVGRLEASNASADLVSNACLERDRARKAARQAIASKEFASFGRDARSVAADDSRQNLRQFGAAALTRAQRKLMKRARGIDWRDAGERHAMRIRIKRLRYSCEFFATAFAARRAAPYIAALKALQEILGELNDIAVGRRLLGFDADETALLRKLAPAWAALAKRPVFWRAAG